MDNAMIALFVSGVALGAVFTPVVIIVGIIIRVVTELYFTRGKKEEG